MKRLLQAIDGNDLMVFFGMVLLTSGSYFIYPPLGLVVPGVILFTLGIVGAIRRS
jgi:hypothetical protein